MGLIGKMIGGTIGFALGGPLGAIAGAAFGHAYDKIETTQVTSISKGDNAQLTFFVAAFSMIAKLARVDGRVSNTEMKSIEEFMSRDLDFDSKSKKIAIDIFKTAVDSSETFEGFAVQFYNQFKSQPRLLELMIDILVRVSVADGKSSQSEQELILSAVRIFNFSSNQYETIRSKYIKEIGKYYALLGCNSDSSNEHIKKQYRKLVKDYHPDKIASKGLPEEFIKFANEKFREIQKAYNMIKRERDF